VALAVLAVAGPAMLVSPGEKVWYVVHVASAMGGAVCFAVAALAGAAYIRTDKRLRRKDPALLGSHWPSLEGLDRCIRHLLPLGLGLLTVAIASGICDALQPSRAGWFKIWQTHPKMLVASLAWLFCAAAMQVAYARRFRGRQVAAMSITIFALLLVVMIANIFVPSR
jgi:ABC-type uncharacterized transport system permease subunit